MAKELTTKEVAKRLGVTIPTITRWIDAGYFPGTYKSNPFRPTSPWRIPEAAVKAFEEARQGQS